MKKTVAIGVQDFAVMRENHYYYIDKSDFIREWWNSGDMVTLLTRPRRFGKTMNMSMLECFFSNQYEGRPDLFEGLEIWKDKEFRELQGTRPVIALSFGGVKHTDYLTLKKLINRQIASVFKKYEWVLENSIFTDADRKDFKSISINMDDATAAISLNLLCEWLHRFYNKKCIVLLDEYDTPMQEAYLHGYWDELMVYIRALFNNTFKTNVYLERGVLTGVTRISKESIFSDLNNLNVVTTTSREYMTSFGFTETEVFAALDDFGISETEKERVKFWYDGFTFGITRDIYNPWSVMMYLDKKSFDTYWANTSSNELAGKLIREGEKEVKTEFERLLEGACIETELDEQIIFEQLSENRSAVWSLLLAAGYLRVDTVLQEEPEKERIYRLKLTNFEVKKMFHKMVKGWFEKTASFHEFVTAMFRGDVRSMNHYMNKVALNTFSYFDTGRHPSEKKEPERFYHGFVLGLLVDKAENYMLKSNRESGLGRYDVVMEPKNIKDPAVIMEFKVFDEEDEEKTLQDTAQNALDQIRERHYAADLLQRGIPDERILKYGFAFQGETCLIRRG